MRLYAVLADIHGNYPALQAVERDARDIAQREKVDGPHFICLGDVVDYGPQPNECMAWVREHASIVVQGNHDKAVVGPSCGSVHTINRDYWPITLWTYQVLDDRHKDVIREWRLQRKALKAFTLFHGSLIWGVDGSIDYGKAARENMARLRTDYGLFGHTHIQGYFEEDLDEVTVFLTCPEGKAPQRTDGWRPMPVGVWERLPEWRKAFFNPGSVGQPRRHAFSMDAGVSHDYRAAYMLLRLNGRGKGFFQFRRVDYDVGETVRRLREIRWPEETGSEVGGNSIYKDKKDAAPRLQDLIERQLAETLAHITERLPRLVEEVLIPALQ